MTGVGSAILAIVRRTSRQLLAISEPLQGPPTPTLLRWNLTTMLPIEHAPHREVHAEFLVVMLDPRGNE